jgi:hypothetical protein
MKLRAEKVWRWHGRFKADLARSRTLAFFAENLGRFDQEQRPASCGEVIGLAHAPSTGEPAAKPDRKPPFPIIRIERRRLRQHRQKRPRQ